MARRDGPGFRFALCTVTVLVGLCVFPAGPASASCSGGGVEVDLVATGTVEDIEATRSSSRIAVLVEKVSGGDRSKNGQTLYIRSESGIGEFSSVDVAFREGARYKLYLRRSGDEWTTNTCMGTTEILAEAPVASPTTPETGGPRVLPLVALAGLLVLGIGAVAWRRLW